VSERDALVCALWEKAPESGDGGGQCVEVLVTPTGTRMRTSRNPQAGHLTVDADAWARLTARVASLGADA